MPTLNLTVNAIKALRAPDTGRRSYKDRRTAGLGIMVLESGSKLFFWQRKVRGRRTWKTLGPFPDLTVENARSRADEKNVKLADWKSRGYPGVNPFEEIDEPTLGEVLEDYVENWVKSNAKNPVRACKDLRWQFKHYAESLRNRKLSTITSDDVQKLHRSVGAKHGHYAANRLLETLHALYVRAKHEPNPTNDVEEFEEKPRERLLERGEFKRLLSVLDSKKGETVHDFVYLLLVTGVRSGDLYAMRWQDTDLNCKEPVWFVPDPKSGKSYDVALVPEAVKILASRKRDTPWVFPGRRRGMHLTSLKKQWTKLLTEAKITDFRVHDFRHMYVSYMLSAGASSYITSKAVGHASTAMVERVYGKLTSRAPVREAALLGTALMFRDARGGKP